MKIQSQSLPDRGRENGRDYNQLGCESIRRNERRAEVKEIWECRGSAFMLMKYRSTTTFICLIVLTTARAKVGG